jgi:hypothetical protein
MADTAASIATISGAAPRAAVFSPALARGILLLVIAAAAAAGAMAAAAPASSLAAAHAGADLIRLLRFMAVLKAAIAVTAAAAVFWRLGAAITLPWFAIYAAACASMAAGPGLIWAMVHVGLGAALLHGGLLAVILLLWRDPATASRLQAILLLRR